MRYPKLRELKEAIKALIRGPYTTRFPYEPHTPAERFRGRPVPDEKECIACGACAEVCPAVAIEVIDDLNSAPPTRQVIWHYDMCIFCGQCERLCTTKKGVKLSNKEFDLATLDRKTLFAGVKKELLVCQSCGTVIAPIDQILWISKKLGHMTYGNYLEFTVIQELLKKNKLELLMPVTELPLNRDDMFRFFCPKCRRQILLFDEYGIK